MSANEIKQTAGPEAHAGDRDDAAPGPDILSTRPSDVVIANGLRQRPRRVPDIQAEAAALQELAALVTVDPRQAITRTLEWAIALCGAGSVGLSLLEIGRDGAAWFRWDEIAGPLSIHAGGGTPRHASPCGPCFEARGTILVSRPFAAFEAPNAAQIPVIEGLVAPLFDTGRLPVGTVWMVHHDVTRRFDAEDARVLEQLAAVLLLALKARQAGSTDLPSPYGASPFASQARPALGRADPDREDGTAPAPTAEIGASRNPFVRKLATFTTLSDDDGAFLEHLTAEARPVAARASLIREGDPPGGLLLVIEGMACRSKILARGTRQITAYLLPGDSCDLGVALLRTLDHGVTMMTPGRVVRIPEGTVSDLRRNRPAIARALGAAARVDEATLREWLINVGCRSALARLAHLFCELQVRLQAVGLATDESFDLPITQLDLADTTGLSNVHVNRTLQELRRRGLIVLTAKSVTVPDLAGLRALAEFKPDYLHAAAPT